MGFCLRNLGHLNLVKLGDGLFHKAMGLLLAQLNLVVSDLVNQGFLLSGSQTSKHRHKLSEDLFVVFELFQARFRVEVERLDEQFEIV